MIMNPNPPDSFWDQYQQAPTSGINDMGDGPNGWNQPRSGPTTPSPTTGINGGNQQTPQPQGLPGNPQLPGYGDWSTSNPWRDSLSYDDIRKYGGNAGSGGAPSPGGTPAPSGGAGGKDAFGKAWLASGGKTNADLAAFVQAHPEYGVKLGGSKMNKIYGPNGEYWAQGTQSGGLGGVAGIWDTSAGGGAGSAGGGAMGAMGPWMQPYDKQYTLPTAADLQGMPGFQVGMDAFNRSQQNSAAARGTLLNGRTNEAMGQAATNYAMQQYGNLAMLGKGAFDTNYDIFKRNQDAPFDKAYRTASLGQTAAASS